MPVLAADLLLAIVCAALAGAAIPLQLDHLCGGIFGLIFEDIALQAKVEYHWAPALGAVAGFMLGMAGAALVS